MIYSFISTFIAMMLIFLLITPFNNLAGKNLTLSLFTNPTLLLGIILFALLVGLIAGSYPAFYLNGIQALRSFKKEKSVLGLKIQNSETRW
ncbi:MAG: hypothetical protein U5K54_06620 [Cytophagales bacterium]|nr:hypothetical protein [Cytophagales bacterium]